ncbi:Vitamin B12 dependent methionine synthase, activation domain [Caminicella sporogenes DSM 14501]|uniref:Vitamin B12 dependent methionine synthase, activation domain n=1 Tax=Caminicella sporogenes DSM 14501 TaxID=1121266 RepID=A0A1M6SKM7_9FIRM|nr:vitamin B12 dependent-methionine synthase activation domain-containing protein [Caminicella sporogenes]RKD26525.1 hypothetical protein BET04_10375 [Caminicella sporogenes]WIF95385.1 vitamin B12 dependent-methionine synthase activation domain-containing protein [Caminicella sporogenes]SHK45291.1 Vitamin B12 dependent methionine synthase, activation domain [Caminicella sporogenes DSM 14501]
MSVYIDYNPVNREEVGINIDKREVLRYLGYKNGAVDSKIDKMINECIVELKEIAKTNFVFNIFDISKKNNEVFIGNKIFKLEGRDIVKHLKNSEKCAVMAATLGSEVDKKIMYYGKIDLVKSIVFDACATAGIEALCDSVETIIKKIAANNGYYITSRYSPGYGDFPINVQFKILELLTAFQNIGLTITDSCILVPRKSVTALIGFSKKGNITEKKDCKNCRLFKNCLFIKEGDNCGNTKNIK